MRDICQKHIEELAGKKKSTGQGFVISDPQSFTDFILSYNVRTQGGKTYNITSMDFTSGHFTGFLTFTLLLPFKYNSVLSVVSNKYGARQLITETYTGLGVTNKVSGGTFNVSCLLNDVQSLEFYIYSTDSNLICELSQYTDMSSISNIWDINRFYIGDIITYGE
jgi:hypothetical protein